MNYLQYNNSSSTKLSICLRLSDETYFRQSLRNKLNVMNVSLKVFRSTGDVLNKSC